LAKQVIGSSVASKIRLDWKKDMKFNRITVNANQMGGVPCIRGLRIPVATVVGMIADGMTEEEILKAYPDIEPQDIRESMQYAAKILANWPLCGVI